MRNVHWHTNFPRTPGCHTHLKQGKLYGSWWIFRLRFNRRSAVYLYSYQRTSRVQRDHDILHRNDSNWVNAGKGGGYERFGVIQYRLAKRIETSLRNVDVRKKHRYGAD